MWLFLAGSLGVRRERMASVVVVGRMYGAEEQFLCVAVILNP